MKKLFMILVALLPSNILRILAYRLLAGYDISFDSRIGMFNLILCNKLCVKTALIGNFNVIKAKYLEMAPGSSIRKNNGLTDVNRVVLDESAMMVSGNRIVGTRPGLSPFKENENLLIGARVVITVGHRFDLSDSIILGNNVTIGGTLSEIWTHGFDLDHVKIQAPVTIGNDVYIGSRSLILPGVDICDRASVGAGTVVSKSIVQPGFYVSSQLQRKGEGQDYSQMEGVVSHGDAKFFRK